MADLGQRAHHKMVDLVVQGRRGLDILAVIGRGDLFSFWGGKTGAKERGNNWSGLLFVACGENLAKINSCLPRRRPQGTETFLQPRCIW